VARACAYEPRNHRATRPDTRQVIHALWNGFCELLAPLRCAACGGTSTEGFCAGCAPLLEHLDPAREVVFQDRAAAVYGGPLAEALQAVKYARDTTRVAALAALLLPHAERLRGQIDLVTCVPLHPRRLRERGFNQSALLAAPVARYLAAPLRTGLLKRRRDTPQQAGAGREERLGLADDCLVAPRPLSGQRVLVIDDVRTTGSTLRAARAALSSAGAGPVLSLVVAAAG
jgi:ComF family protein